MKQNNRHSRLTGVGGALALLTLIALSACGGGGGGNADGNTNPPPGDGNNNPPPVSLTKRNSLYSPVRIAEGVDGTLYVSDTNSNSVFIIQNLLVKNELTNLARPLGVAVDVQGNIYVGNDDRDNVEEYDASGNLLRRFGNGQIQMPNDLALDGSGNLYVVDSMANAVKVFAPNGMLLRTIGASRLKFPVSLCIADSSGNSGAEELFVADQEHGMVQVFALDGTYLRSFGSRLPYGDIAWPGKFVQIQSIAVDALGRVHALDSVLLQVQVLDAMTGEFIESYGSKGNAEGQLNVPLDIMFTKNRQIMVTNFGNHRIDMLRDMN
jgi:outer membrane protein assembly factor BamB